MLLLIAHVFEVLCFDSIADESGGVGGSSRTPWSDGVLKISFQDLPHSFQSCRKRQKTHERPKVSKAVSTGWPKQTISNVELGKGFFSLEEKHTHTI